MKPPITTGCRRNGKISRIVCEAPPPALKRLQELLAPLGVDEIMVDRLDAGEIDFANLPAKIFALVCFVDTRLRRQEIEAGIDGAAKALEIEFGLKIVTKANYWWTAEKFPGRRRLQDFLAKRGDIFSYVAPSD